MRGCFVACLLAGCGRIDFEPRGDGPDARAPLNYVFVTEPVLGGALGGLAGADAICNQRARDAGLPDTYVAWLSTSTTNAIDRIANARGWIRPDGTPFADSPADVMTSRVLSSIAIAADGTSQLAMPVHSVMTGTNDKGQLQLPSCSDWTTTAGDYWSGELFAAGFTFTNGSLVTTGCTQQINRVYCFGIDHATPLVVAPATGRRAFVTSTIWSPAGGLATADAVCQSEADAAQLGGTFRALLATSSATAASRFGAGATWVRRDGVPLAATAADVMAGAWNVPLNLDANGTYVSFYDTPTSTSWGGAPAPDQPADATCQDWTVAAMNATGTSGHPHYAGARGFADMTYSCNFSFRLYCFEP